MNAVWSAFSPWSARAGRLLIGLATFPFILLYGRVLGISSIVSVAIRSPLSDWLWRLTFVLGLLGAPWVYHRIAPLPPLEIDAGWPTSPISRLPFKAGWGLAGLGPGRAIVSLIIGGVGVYVFVVAMLSGMVFFECLEWISRRRLTSGD